MMKLCLIIIFIVIALLCITNTRDFLKTENYTPVIARPLIGFENQNTCSFPYTNVKPMSKYKEANSKVYVSQYGNRKILNPNNYLELVKQLFDDLSLKNVNVSNIPNNLLTEKNYMGDSSFITNHINSEINKLVNKETYLQNNGPWKNEYFSVSEPKIYYYEINNSSKYFSNLPDKFNLFKIIYTLGNPLRSSYTSSLAFITEINDKLEIQYTTFVNKFEEDNNNDKIKVIPQEALEFSFIDTLANNNFDQFGHSTDYSGLNYIEEPREGYNIEIKADIPKEFKEQNFQAQHLPPQFGNGIIKYPPCYKTESGEVKLFEDPPTN